MYFITILIYFSKYSYFKVNPHQHSHHPGHEDDGGQDHADHQQVPGTSVVRNADLEKVVEPGNLVPRKYLGCKKIFSPNPVLLSKIKTCVANPALLEFRLMKGKFHFLKLGVNVQMLNIY